MKYETDAALIGALRALHQADQRAATAEPRAHGRDIAPRLGRPTIRSRSGLRLGLPVFAVCAIAVALVVPTLLRSSGSAGSIVASETPTASEQTPDAVASSTIPSTPSPVQPSPVPTDHVFPASVYGQPVLQGQAVVDQFSRSFSEPVLVGGWVRITISDGKGESGTTVSFSPYAFPRPSPGELGVPQKIRLTGPTDQVFSVSGQPVVLRVHSDPSCSTSRQGCPAWWLDAVVWKG
jgi:hypothetical protein